MYMVEETERLLIDCTYIRAGWKPTNSLVIYAVRLIQGFIRYSNYQVQVLVWRDMESFLDELVGYKLDKIVLGLSDLTIKWRPYYRMTRFLPHKLMQEIKCRDISIVLHPYHYGNLFFFPKPIKQYGIMHDMFLYEKVKDERGCISYFIWHCYQRSLLKKFIGLISISKHTQKEFIKKEGISSEVVYNSINFDFAIGEKPVEGIVGKRYIIDVNRFPRSKNTKTLLLAFSRLKHKIPHLLYLKGDYDCEENRLALEKLVYELGLEDRVIFDLSYRTEREMHYLYSHADLFVSPSLREGFGYTPIEAAILKTPVLVSNIEVFKEVTCGMIQTFDPHSPEDLAKHIMEVLVNPPSVEERNALSDFFLDRYSLKSQIKRFEELFES